MTLRDELDTIFRSDRALREAETRLLAGADPDALADVLADADRLARLVDDLLVLERQASPAAAADPVDLTALVHAVAAGAGPDVTVEHADSAATTGDAAALRRALENLLANATVHRAPPVRISDSQESSESPADRDACDDP